MSYKKFNKIQNVNELIIRIKKNKTFKKLIKQMKKTKNKSKKNI